MDLEFTEEESALRDNVRSVLAGICPPSVVRAVYEGKPAPFLWRKMVELDWPAIAIEEAWGGLGMGYIELAIICEELGRAVVPSPFLATLTQFVPAIRELGAVDAAERFLPRVARGGCTGTLAYAESGCWNADAVRTTARRHDDGWVLDGEKHAVMDGATADEIVVIARADNGLGAFVVPGSSVVATSRRVIDATQPVADVWLDEVMVTADRVVSAPGAPDVEDRLARAVQEATVALAISTTGACRRIVDTTLEYVKVREQYNRPIGSFQALKHRLSDMYLSVERATAACYFAALNVAEDTAERATASSVAKAAAGDCQRLVVEEGLQLHGGIGFTWEHDLHFLLKRAKAGDALFGDAVAHRATLARLLGLAS